MKTIKFKIVLIGLFLILFIRNGYCLENQKNANFFNWIIQKNGYSKGWRG